MQLCAAELCQHWIRWWLVAWRESSHHLNQMLTYWLSHKEHISIKFYFAQLKSFHSRRCISKCHLQHGSHFVLIHYSDVIMSVEASQITSLTIVYSALYSGADQRKHQSSASLAFVLGIHRWLVNSLHKWPVMQKMFPFDDIIILNVLKTHQHVKSQHMTIRVMEFLI